MIDVRSIRDMREGAVLTEECSGQELYVARHTRHWTVGLGQGGCSLARSPERAMVYVRNRRRMARRTLAITVDTSRGT